LRIDIRKGCTRAQIQKKVVDKVVSLLASGGS
jgi:hypothetical protein